MEAIVVLVPAPDFKSGGGCGDTSPAGSIPVRFRHGYLQRRGAQPRFQSVPRPAMPGMTRLYQTMIVVCCRGTRFTPQESQ